MKLYIVSLAAGVLVGIIYALMQVRSPAPPVVALIGLLGMLVGEQLVPPVKRLLAGQPVTASWFQAECMPKITGTPATSVASASRHASVQPPESSR
jgi:XapX domain-containing protein